MVGSIDPAKQLAVLDDGTELPFDLFLGIHFEASLALAAEKKAFETSRKARWFGISE